ncbi:MAG: hypothetical protein WED10_11155, partial [Brumimicrobium sp.]
MKKLLFGAIAFVFILYGSYSIAQCTVTAPYTENFDGGSWVPGTGFSNTGDAIDPCWSRNANSGYFFGTRTGTTSSTTTGPSDDFTGGGNYVFTEGSNGSTGDTATIITTDIDLTPLTVPYLTFYYHMYGGDITSLEVEVSDDGGNTWTNEASIVGEQQTDDLDPWEERPINLSAYAGETIQIRFLTIKGASFNCDVAIDEINIDEAPTCPKPTDFMAGTITDTSVELEWVNGGSETMWNIEYGPVGFTQGTGTIVASVSNPDIVNGLNPDTEYDFYIQADCGGGDESDWVGPLSVKTECAPQVAPYLEDFTSGSLPNCWSNTSSNSGSANGLWKFSGTPGYGASSNGRPAGTFAWTDGSTPVVADITLTSPLIDMSTLTVPMLSFDWFSNNTNNPGDNVPLIIEVNDGSGWTNLTTLSGDSPDWQETELVLDSYVGQTVQLRFICDQTVTSGLAQYNDILLDSVLVDEAPSCPKPYDLNASNITASDAELNWTQGYLETEWIVEYDVAGFTPGTGNTVVTNNTTEIISGLTGNTDYDVYVRAICGVGDTSDWTGPAQFKTDCAVSVAPWSEDFENAGTIPDCWEQGASNAKDWEFADNGGFDHIGSNGTINGATNSNGYFAWLDDSAPHEQGTNFLSPMIDVSGLSYPTLSFFLLSDNEGNSNVDFSVDVWDGAAWNDEVFTSNSNTENEAWEEMTVYLSTLTITGPIQIRFSVDENNGTDFYDDIAIDDVQIFDGPSCPPISDITVYNIVPDSATVSWTSNGTETAWNIEYGPAGFTLGTGTVVNTTDNPDTLGGLTPETDYDIYVIADCGGGDLADTIGPVSFTTPPTCPVVSNITASNITSTEADIDWTVGYQETEWMIEYDTTGFTLGTGTTLVTNNLGETLTGLTAITDYDVYVRAICAPGDTSDWTGPTSFTTECPIFAAPFHEPFDNGVQPDCWEN